MVKKMWGLGVGVLIVLLVIGVMSGTFGADVGGQVLMNIIAIFINVIFGTSGNKWREDNLPKRGYEFKETVTATNPEGAIALYMKDHQ